MCSAVDVRTNAFGATLAGSAMLAFDKPKQSVVHAVHACFHVLCNVSMLQLVLVLDFSARFTITRQHRLFGLLC
jgi:uncharacterized membrane protein